MVGDAACDTLNSWLPIATDPVRAAPPFALTATVTVPLPVPDDPPVTVSQPFWLTLVHVHDDATPIEIV